jgi:plasmanylethanolamine desaturase
MTDAGYTPAHRTLEIGGIAIFAALAVWLTWRLGTTTPPNHAWIIPVAAIAGYIAADLMSGIVHWAFDTWGSADTPVLGASFIRPFREHHVDAASITRHDFVETNGNSSLASIPVLLAASFVPLDGMSGRFAVTFLLVTSLAVFATNQFHKWAHTEQPGALVRVLQRCRLILPRDHHLIHHAAPYATHYCITTGWLNPLLHSIDFHRRLERIIVIVTGAEPRGGSLEHR